MTAQTVPARAVPAQGLLTGVPHVVNVGVDAFAGPPRARARR